jgi:hypothetical protein
MGGGPTICGPIHTLLLAMRPLAIVPGKADCPTGRIGRFLVFSYPCPSPSAICIVRLQHGRENMMSDLGESASASHYC